MSITMSTINSHLDEAMLTFSAHKKTDLTLECEEIKLLSENPDLPKILHDVEVSEASIIRELTVLEKRFHEVEEIGIKARMAQMLVENK